MEEHEAQKEPQLESAGPETETGAGEEGKSARVHFSSFSEALQSAREDAIDKAKVAAPKIKSVVADAVYGVAYGGAFGAVFLGAFASELVPRAIKDGVVKGARAGRRTACRARDKVCEAVATAKNAETPGSGVVIDIDGEPAGA